MRLKTKKQAAYANAVAEIDAVLEGESQIILKMTTINCLLKKHFDYFYWIGFYLVHNGALIVGPYQGTLGCLHINFEQGVCGKAARTQTTQIVGDVHLLEQGTEHIACDPLTQSEIVVPVFDNAGKLIAVFDVDSTEKDSFDQTDQYFMEALIGNHFSKLPLEKNYL